MSSTGQFSQRILVADDDPVIRHLVTTIVRKEGYTPVVVNDGRETIRLLRSDANFKAAIFDMVMPHIEGIEIIRYMRTERRLMRIPAMMITSEQDLKLMTNSFEAGATVFLPKPFKTAQLQTMLRMLLSKADADNRALRSNGRA
jgi:CheY-like chemotaxis protein